MNYEDVLCSVCSKRIETNKEVAEGRIVWQYAEGYVPMARPGKKGGINRIRLIAKHRRFAHDVCLKENKRTIYVSPQLVGSR